MAPACQCIVPAQSVTNRKGVTRQRPGSGQWHQQEGALTHTLVFDLQKLTFARGYSQLAAGPGQNVRPGRREKREIRHLGQP